MLKAFCSNVECAQVYQGRSINEAVRKGEALRCEKCLNPLLPEKTGYHDEG